MAVAGITDSRNYGLTDKAKPARSLQFTAVLYILYLPILSIPFSTFYTNFSPLPLDFRQKTLQHYNNITKRQQTTEDSSNLWSRGLVDLQTAKHNAAAYLPSVFFPASNPQAAIISSPREARIVVIIPCEVR